ncbi:endonuclease [Mycoplasma sp. 4013]
MKFNKKLLSLSFFIPAAAAIATSCASHPSKVDKKSGDKDDNQTTTSGQSADKTTNPGSKTNPVTTEEDRSPINLTDTSNLVYKPSNYYASADGKKGMDLWRALEMHHHGIRAGILHGSVIYEALKTFYNESNAYKDLYYKKDKSILDIFTAQPDKTNFASKQTFVENANSSSENTAQMRGHLIPEKWYSSDDPMQPDPFVTWPLDTFVNSKRGNFPFGEVKNVTFTFKNGSKLGTNNKGQMVFEVIDKFKGDVARSVLYFILMYYEKNIYSDASNNLFISNFPYIKDDFLHTLLKWDMQDPVDAVDINRNNEIFKKYQFRNPFIDYPNLPANLFGAMPDTFNDKGILVSNGDNAVIKE